MPEPIPSYSPNQSTWADPDPTHEGSCSGPGPLACYADGTTPAPATPVADAGAGGTSGTNGEGGSRGTSGNDDTGAHPDAVRALCMQRLVTNVLCGALGTAVAARLGGGLAKELVAQAVTAACVQTSEWLDSGSPGGACGKGQ